MEEKQLVPVNQAATVPSESDLPKNGKEHLSNGNSHHPTEEEKKDENGQKINGVPL